MPPVVLAVVSTGPGPSVAILWVLGAVLAVVCVVILLGFYRPNRLDERIRIRHRVRANEPTAVLGGSGAAHISGDFDGGSGGFEGGSFDGSGGGQC